MIVFVVGHAEQHMEQGKKSLSSTGSSGQKNQQCLETQNSREIKSFIVRIFDSCE